MKIEDWLIPENLYLIALGIVIGAVGLIGIEAACDADVAAQSYASTASERFRTSKTPLIDEELLRCATLPIEQANDPKCRALWTTQARKFLTPNERRNESEETLDIFPSLPRALEKPRSNPTPAQEEE